MMGGGEGFIFSVCSMSGLADHQQHAVGGPCSEQDSGSGTLAPKVVFRVYVRSTYSVDQSEQKSVR